MENEKKILDNIKNECNSIDDAIQDEKQVVIINSIIIRNVKINYMI